MPDREHIPNELQRQLMLEVGYRCPLCKQTEPLEFEHIEDYAAVKKHEFTNMIVLCASCHGRKKDSSNPKHINRASLRKLKQNLMMLNGRYSDLERRIIELFREKISGNSAATPATLVHHTLGLLVRNLEFDGIVTTRLQYGGIEASGYQGIPITNDQLLLILTPLGRAFLDNLASVAEWPHLAQNALVLTSSMPEALRTSPRTITSLVAAPHLPFGHPLPASGERGGPRHCLRAATGSLPSLDDRAGQVGFAQLQTYDARLPTAG